MHRFKFRKNELYCEEVRVKDIIEKFGSPLYIYSSNIILDHYYKLKKAFQEFNPLICFSVKSNNNLAILKLLVKNNAGMDIVSGGELYKVIKAGCPPSKIVYAGVGKTNDEIEFAIRKGVLFFNIESLQELTKVNEIAKRLGRKQAVCIRLNPGIEPKTHKYIKTSSKYSKFGMEYKIVKDIFLNKAKYPNLEINGIHIHIGSQIVDMEPLLKSIKKVLKLREELNKRGIDFNVINIGGGLGIIYKNEKPLTAGKYGKEIKKLIKNFKGLLILEPGRFIVGNAGILVTKILYLKNTLKNFAIVDAGMNLLIRPALYSAYHDIQPILKRKKKIKISIVGPICESSDFFGYDRLIPEVKQEEFLAIFGVGAYGASMASNYNCQPKAREVMVKDNKFWLIREKDSYRDLIRKDLIPEFLK
jgi:diaminopimelate decarboxylase